MTIEQQALALDYCDTCNGPCLGRSRFELAMSHVAYWVWMRLPGWLAMGKPGFSILPYAGNIAFGCSCADKNAHVRALAKHGLAITKEAVS